MDTFFNNKRQLEVLKEQYNKHGHIIVFFDFDDTISKYRGVDCSMTQQLIRDLDPYSYLVCFTARDTNEEEEYEYVENFLLTNEIPFDYINREWDGKAFTNKKPLYNEFLDDKASLGSTYKLLKAFLKWVEKQD